MSLTAGYAALPAAAADNTSMSLSSSATNVKTSTGKSVNVSVFASRYDFGGSSSGSVSITLRSGSFTHGESHTWSFQVDPSDFDYNSSTGKGTLNTGNDLGPFGTVILHFDKSSQSKTNCPDTGSTTTAKGTLKGSVDFDSTSNSWGKVHANNLGFDTPNYLSVSTNCTGEGNFQRFCSRTINWNAPSQPASSATGLTVTAGGKSTTTISGSHFVFLNNPSGATRSDYVSDAAPKPGIDGSKLTIKTKNGTRVSGSATISGGDTNKDSYACKKGSKKLHEHVKAHSGGKWSSPHGIKFNQTAFADFKTLTDGTSGWSKQTYS